jgi:hypothetical protein
MSSGGSWSVTSVLRMISDGHWVYTRGFEKVACKQADLGYVSITSGRKTRLTKKGQKRLAELKTRYEK